VFAADDATAKAAAVDALFADVDSTRTPGCAVGVMQGGALVFARGYGMADLDHGIPNTPSSVFHVASMSKQFTAAAILLLAREGKLSLDDDVRKYVPEVPDFGVPITISNLIHHTSGLRDQWEMLSLAGWRYSLDLITDADVLAVLARQKHLNFPPNTQYSYSNTGYTLLAQIVARVSGMTFREFTTARIFAPLGMARTHFRDDHAEIVHEIAYGYEPVGDVFKLSVTNFDTVGATSLLTTVEDLARWDENFYWPRVGDSDFVAAMIEPGALADGRKLGYAFGLTRGTYRGLEIVDHAGADAGYRSDLVRFPSKHFSVSCLCNVKAMNPSELTRKVADIYLADALAALPGAAAQTLTKRQRDTLPGNYLEKDKGAQVIRVSATGDALTMQLSGSPPFELRPAGNDSFRLAVAPDVTLAWTGRGDERVLTVTNPPQPTRAFVPVAEYAPHEADLAAYAGTYTSEEVDVKYEIIATDAGLVMRSLKLPATPLAPLVPDLFSADFGTLRFTRDDRGAVTGYLVNTLNTTDFAFARAR
jgi:CubicO group peptidase (beta-lactamase class C family)